ncbi:MULTISPECIES: hypothetical protein [unclassified Curtobacterium]|uniref:hypothetical protein n=1 Tax=unclassified Curtobacterium TaxID=257496 RepID=UPI003807B97E
MPANRLLELDPLPLALTTHPETAGAARRLVGAHDSVQGLFATLQAARQQKILRGVSVRRLEHGEVDLLRAAIVFAGAGLDAVLKQLVRDALTALLESHPATKTSLNRFVAEMVRGEPKRAQRILGAPSADTALRVEYVDSITKGSLQTEKDLRAVRNALGIAPSGAFTDANLATFADFFIARNEIVHELDLQASGPGIPTRRARKMSPVRDLANEAISITAQFVVATDALL